MAALSCLDATLSGTRYRFPPLRTGYASLKSPPQQLEIPQSSPCSHKGDKKCFGKVFLCHLPLLSLVQLFQLMDQFKVSCVQATKVWHDIKTMRLIINVQSVLLAMTIRFTTEVTVANTPRRPTPRCSSTATHLVWPTSTHLAMADR